MAEPLIYTSDSPENTLPFLGIQGQNLWQMAQKGLPVLPFWALSPTPFQQICSEHAEELQKWLSRINLQSRLSLEQTSFKLVQLMQSLNLPSALQKNLNHVLPNDGIYSLQAYIVSENPDLRNLSQYIEPQLCLPRQALEENLKNCWARLFCEDVLQALDAQGLAPTEVPIRILIQKMIPGRASGRVMTAHPQGDLNELLIEAHYGLQPAQSDETLTESEAYLYLRDQHSWDLQVREKWEQWVPAPEGGLTLSKVPVQLRSQAILNRPMRESLVALALRTEELYKHHQALDWIQDAQGQFWLMQTQPLTRIPKGKLAFFARYGLAKRYPGITAPLTYSHVRRQTRESWTQALKRLGFSLQHSALPHALEDLLGHLDGRVYYQLGAWQELFQLLPEKEAETGPWEKWLECTSPLDAAPIPSLQWGPHSRDWLAFVRRWKPFRKALDREMGQHLKNRETLLQWLKTEDFSRLEAQDLLACYSRICADLQPSQEVPLLNLGLLRVFVSLSQKALIRGGLSDPQALLADFFNAELQAQDCAAEQARQQLAEQVANDADLRDFILRYQEDPEILKRLRYSHFEVFYQALCSYLDLYPAPSSAKLEALSLFESPAPLLSALLAPPKSSDELAQTQAEATELRKAATERLKQESQLSPFLQAGLNHCLKQTRRHLHYHLQAEQVEMRILRYVHQLFNALGEKLLAAGALNHPREIFLLSIEEIQAFVCGHGGLPSLQARLQERGEEARRWESRNPRAYLRTQGPVSLNQIPQERPARGAILPEVQALTEVRSS